MADGRPYFPQLDGFRAIAVVLVIVGHETYFGGHEGLGALDSLAVLGVLLFFVLSGFLITTLLLSEEHRLGHIRLGAFYWRRALRILPAVYFFLAVIAVLAALGLVTDTPWSNFAVAAFYVRNIFGHGETLGHLWSLSLEEQFYFAWPLTMVLAPARARLPIAASLVAAIAAWRATAIILHLYDYNLAITYMRTDFRADSILAGCALALGLQAKLHPRVAAVLTSTAKLAHPLAVVAALAASYLPPPAWFAPYARTLQTLLAVLLLGRIVIVKGLSSRLLSTAPLRWVGRLSYSWYLWQQPFLATKTPSWGWVREFPADIAASLVVAVASYYVVERPFLRLKDAFESRSAMASHPARAPSSVGERASADVDSPR